MWLSFVFKYRKAKGSFLEIAAPLKGGHSQTGTGRSPERQGPCQCQEHKSSFYAGEDALRINVMSCGALPWPQQAMGTAGLPPSSIPACSDPSLHSLQPHISGFAGTKAGQTGTFEPHPTTSLNHIPSKQKCPGKKGEEKWSACQKTLNLWFSHFDSYYMQCYQFYSLTAVGNFLLSVMVFLPFAWALRQQLVLWQVAAQLHLQPRLYHSQVLRFSFPLGKKVTLKHQDF